jgi:Sulfotransferase family
MSQDAWNIGKLWRRPSHDDCRRFKFQATPRTASARKERIETRFGFVHIPKTAGISFNTLLQRQFGDRFRVISPPNYTMFPELLAPAAIVSGHIPHYVYQWEDQPRRLFTILRDPISRIISNYRFILANPGHYAHEYIRTGRLALSECFNHPILRIEFTNFQTKMIGWRPSELSRFPIDNVEKYRIYHDQNARFSFLAADHATLEAAMAALSDGMLFAVIEDQNSVVDLYRAVTSITITELPFENRTPSVDYKVTQTDLDAILRNNELDLELYSFAVDALPRQRMLQYSISGPTPRRAGMR